MKHKTYLITQCVAFCLLAINFSAFAQILPKEHPLHQEIEKIIFYDTGIRSDLVPGIIIGVVDGDSSYILSFGSKTFSDKSSIDVDDIFEVGSIAKIMTAAAIYRLERTKAISIESSIAELTDDFYAQSNIGHLTINQLIHHQTGLPKYPAYIGSRETKINQPYAEYTKEDLNEFLQQVNKPVLEGDFLYSHINYALLELVLEQHFPETYSELMRKYLFEPLGMPKTNFNSLEGKITPGFTLAGELSEVREFASFSAAEGLHSSMRDLMTFLKWTLEDENADIWRAENADEIKKVKISQVKGWFVDRPGKKHSMYIHSGKSNGHHALMGIVPETKTGVVVLSNSAHGTQDLGPLILRMLNQNWKRKPLKNG